METAVDTEWAFQRFGAHGKALPHTVLSTLVDCHNEHADGQSLIDSRHKRSYGQVSYTVQERLETALAGAEGVEFKRPAKGKPKVMVINGTALVQWRYSRKAADDPRGRIYGTSDARVGNFSMPVGHTQGRLDLGDGAKASLSPEEIELVETLQELNDAGAGPHHRVVVVAYASNYKSLHRAVWADAHLDEDGSLVLENEQVLYDGDSLDSVDAAETKRFDSQPRRALRLQPRDGTGS